MLSLSVAITDKAVSGSYYHSVLALFFVRKSSCYYEQQGYYINQLILDVFF